MSTRFVIFTKEPHQSFKLRSYYSSTSSMVPYFLLCQFITFYYFEYNITERVIQTLTSCYLATLNICSSFTGYSVQSSFSFVLLSPALGHCNSSHVYTRRVGNMFTREAPKQNSHIFVYVYQMNLIYDLQSKDSH